MSIRYYKTRSGRNPVMEFVTQLEAHAQQDFLDFVTLLEQGEMIGPPNSKPLPRIHKGLYEMRIKDKAGIVRIFYYIKSKGMIYLLHAYSKKTQKIPAKEKDVILRRIREV